MVGRRYTMSKFGHGWRWEKSKNVVVQLCHILENVKTIPAQFGPQSVDLREDFRGILHNATKLLCEAIEEHHGDGSRWSPELVDYLFLHPEKCNETLEILESEDYRDGYYDKPNDA